MQLHPPGNSNALPVNQAGGVNNTFQPDGTNTITTGANAVPVNWMGTSATQAGIGAYYTITFTYVATSSGGVTTITNNNVALSLATPQFPGATGGTGIGAANFSYVIKTVLGITVASGTGNTNNTI